MKQVHIIAVLVIFSIVLLLFLSSFLPHNESEASTASETEKSKLLRLREEAIRDYVSHLEQEVMQLAIDKKNGKVVVHRDHKDLQRGAVKLTSSTASLSNEANRPRGSSSGIHQRHGNIDNTVVGDLHGSGDPVDGENREVVGSMFEHDTSSQTVLGYSLDKHNPVDAELLQQQTKQKEKDQLEEQHAIEAHIDHKASQTSWTKLVSAFIGQKDAIKAVSVAIDPDFYTWQESLIRKLHCYMKSNSNIAFYHYHARKAAGTTLRDVVKMSLLYAKTISSARSSAQSFRLRSMQSKNYKLPSIIDGYYETEGLVLNPELLQQRDLFTITSLREPISRILSLYWYEHVGWFEGVLRQGERCKTLSQWVEYWRDNSEFKHEFHMKNPGNNYIDIENYYVKMLVGWKGDRVLTRSDLEQAKTILRHFDMVFITEWMEDETQMDVMNALFTGRTQVTAGYKVTGNFRMKEKMKPKLLPNEEEIKKELEKMNSLDLELYDYAQSLMSFRLKHIIPIVEKVRKIIVQQQVVQVKAGEDLAATAEDTNALQCPVSQSDIMTRKKVMTTTYKNSLGVHQPPGHKGP